jgi:hypothetical protein
MFPIRFELAFYNGQGSVWNAPCVPDDYWFFNQRHHQYTNTHTEPHGGVTLSIDNVCSDAQVVPYANSDGNSGFGPAAHPGCI